MADGTTTTDLLTRSMSLRAFREDLREVDFVCSNEDVDSYGTRFTQSGWDFTRYALNPVVLWAHCSRELPVGQAIRYSVQGDELIATVRIATEKANPKAENVWQSILERTLRGISVGFDPLEYHFERVTPGADEILVFDRQLLLELSISPLPSNAGTIAKMRQRAMSVPNAPPTPATLDNVTERAALTDQGTTPMSLPATDDAAALKTKVTELETQNRDLDFKSREATKAAADHEKRAVELASKVEVLELQTKRLGEERDAATTARDIAEGKVIASEVDALVGVKISAAERDGFAKLCKQDRTLFDQMIAQRSDMKLTEQIVPSDKNDVPPPPVLDERAKKEAAAKRDFAELEAAADKDD